VATMNVLKNKNWL